MWQAWSKIRPTRLRRLHADGGGCAAGTGSRRQRAKPSKKGVHLHEKKGGWIPSLPIHQSLRPFGCRVAFWRVFFSNGEWRRHRPLGYARPWRQTPFFVSLFRLLLFFCCWPPFLLLPLTCRGFTSSSSTLSCWLKTQWQKKPCVLCLLAYYSVRKIFFLRVATTVNWPRKNFYCLFVKLESATVKDLDWLFFTSKCWK